MSFIQNIKNEFLKTKSTFCWWLIHLGGALIPFIFFMVQLFRHEGFIPPVGTNIWETVYEDLFRGSAKGLFPLFLALLIAFYFSIEHKAESWKKLFVLPQSRDSLFLAKLSFCLMMVVYTLFIFSVSILLFGAILGVIHPELRYLESDLNLLLLMKCAVKLFTGMLGLIAIQFTLSYWFKSFIFPLGIGLFCIVAGPLLFQWEHSVYIPFTHSIFLNLHLKGEVAPEYTLGLLEYQQIGLLYFLGFTLLSWLLFKLKRI